MKVSRYTFASMLLALSMLAVVVPASATIEVQSFDVQLVEVVQADTTADVLNLEVEKVELETADPVQKEILLAPGICIDRRRSCNKSIDVEAELSDAADELLALSREAEKLNLS